MDLQLGLSLPSFHYSDDDDDDDDLFTPSPVSHCHKRSFSDLRDDDGLLPTLPLLPLTPSHEPDPDDEDLHTGSSIVTRRDGDGGGESAAVGWPPLMSQRKKLRFEEDGSLMARDNNHGRHKSGTTTEEPLRECNNALYVKVKMEGEGIGRKVDLSLHHSFQKLKQTLISMFGRCHEHSECYQLAYQDREGDWLLAEDLPWKNFLQCAQRLKLVKRTS